MIESSKIKILLLDDEPYMLKLIGLMLRNLGFTQVTAFSDGRAALEFVDGSDHAPDLILLDLNMPEMDGIEFVRHLVDRQYNGSLILVSGEDERMLQTAESLIRAHRMSVLGRIQKAVTPQTLASLLKTWVPPAAQQLSTARQPYSASEVRAAITQGELVNFYQPQVLVSTGQIVGVETLVRWRHPVHGLVFPDQFIGIAEEHGLIDDLTAAVLAEALSQLKTWLDMGLQLRVAVNVSMDNLASLDFPDFVAKEAAEANVAPRNLVLEVTESRLLKDLRAPLEILTRLRLKRFGLSIDDFGTGHSSLSQLRDFPFDELKVDHSFVHGAAQDETIRAIYDASLGLAKHLNMVSVAEGVEDMADWHFLRRTGCRLAQGYFIARPMPAAELPAWMESWEKRVKNEFLINR
jgi:EAL domain-containing protein (putative c-di-GMP-specific phosphodiesterase class I)/ActR/RegA family two-component response regulator